VPVPYQQSAAALDLGPRVFKSTTVAASPSAATETTVATLTIGGDIGFTAGVLLIGFGAFTVGASGTAVNLRIRRTDTSGAIQAATGATTVTAGNLGSLSVVGFDTGPTLPGQVYVLTATVTAGAAASTFSGVGLIAVVI
jgi:hypothetical protein